MAPISFKPSLSRRVVMTMTLLVTIIGVVAFSPAQDQEQLEYAVQAPLATRSLLLDVTAVDGLIAAVGSRGHILLSEDQGQSWRQVEVPTRSGLTGVFFHDRSLGWAVGHDGVILRTKDGGETWERVFWVPEDKNPLLDVWFKNADEGFAVGAYGSFFLTADGGTTWTFQPVSEFDYHLNQIANSADGRLYMAAEAGLLYRSDDGGVTWIELPSPYGGSFFGALPLEGDTVLAFGLRGNLFRSEDAGETWTSLETHTLSMLTSGIELADGIIVIAGLGGVVLVSSDGGRTFFLNQHENRRGISAVVKASDETLVFVGEFGVRALPMTELSDGKDG